MQGPPHYPGPVVRGRAGLRGGAQARTPGPARPRPRPRHGRRPLTSPYPRAYRFIEEPRRTRRHGGPGGDRAEDLSETRLCPDLRTTPTQAPERPPHPSRRKEWEGGRKGGREVGRTLTSPSLPSPLLPAVFNDFREPRTSKSDSRKILVLRMKDGNVYPLTRVSPPHW